MQINTIGGLYQQVLKEIIGVEVKDKGELLSLMQDFSKAKKEYDTIASALQMVKQTGYGFASASLNDISLSKPETVSYTHLNVGKSTVFNRLIGERKSIVEDTPGVTRDRIYGTVEWLTREFQLIDTGGIQIYTANGYLHIQAPQPEQVHIFTPDGRLLKAFRTSDNEAQIALPQGIYLIRVTNQCVKVVL